MKKILFVILSILFFTSLNYAQVNNNIYTPTPFVPILDNNTFNLLYNKLSNLEAMYGATVDEMKIFLSRDEEYIEKKLKYSDFTVLKRESNNDLVTITYEKSDKSCLIMYGIYKNSCSIASYMYHYNEDIFYAIRNKFNNSNQWKKIGFDNWQIIIGNVPSFKVELNTINNNTVICLNFQN